MDAAMDCKSAGVPFDPSKEIFTFGAKVNVASSLPTGGSRMVTAVPVADFSQPFWIKGCPAWQSADPIIVKARKNAERWRIFFIGVLIKKPT